MFGTIRKHQKWLWLIIITLTIISFVVFFSPYTKMNNDVRSGDFGRISGEKVTEQNFVQARRESELHYFFMTGRWSDEEKNSRYDPMRETYQWLFLIQKQNQLNIRASDDVVDQTARTMIRSFERMGVTSPAIFIDKILKPRGFQVNDFERFIRHYLGIQELMATYGLAGKLITPKEAQGLYERENQELETTAALFFSSNYLASVTVTPEAISSFYSNRLANYRLPERVQVSYVKFNVTNFLAQAETDLKTNLAEIVDENLQRIGTNLTTVFPDVKSPEEGKARIREQVIRGKAMSSARRRALDFATILFDLKNVRPENLQDLAKSNNLAVAVTAPFSRDDVPAGLEVGADFAKAAFNLNAQEPYGGPLNGQDGVYVIAMNKRLPSEQPALDQVKDRVTADYKEALAMAQARQAGLAFYQAATNGLAQNKSFDRICAEAKITPVALPPFSLSTRSLPGMDEVVGIDLLKQLAFGTEPGKVSSFQSTREGGVVLFVKAKLPIDQAKMQAALPAYIDNVRRRRQEEAFSEWFRKEAPVALRDTPWARQQEQQTPANLNGASKS